MFFFKVASTNTPPDILLLLASLFLLPENCYDGPDETGTDCDIVAYYDESEDTTYWDSWCTSPDANGQWGYTGSFSGNVVSELCD